MDKPREIENKIGSIRLANRDAYDRRAQTSLPSATGGRPPTNSPLAAATGTEIVPTVATPKIKPLDDVSTIMRNGEYRTPQKAPGVLSQVPRLNRTIEDYTINNADLVNITASYLQRVAELDPAVLEGFNDANDMALHTVALISRYFEPGEAPPLAGSINESRAGRRASRFLKKISEVYRAEY